jgi:hypothetical protein
MKIAHWLGWCLVVSTGIGLTWAAHRGPPSRTWVPTPASLLRVATAQEWEAANRAGARLSEAVALANNKNHAPDQGLRADQIEGLDPTGRPWLAFAIPDNPLVHGVGSIKADCTFAITTAADWIYCPETNQIRPGGVPPGL